MAKFEWTVEPSLAEVEGECEAVCAADAAAHAEEVGIEKLNDNLDISTVLRIRVWKVTVDENGEKTRKEMEPGDPDWHARDTDSPEKEVGE